MNYGQHKGAWYIWWYNNVHKKCGDGKAWYGWNGGSSVGSLSTRLIGSGSAQLDFGNCWNAGEVKVYLAGREIGSAPANTPTRSVTFDFEDSPTLELKDEGGNSIVQFNSLKIVCEGVYFTTVMQPA